MVLFNCTLLDKLRTVLSIMIGSQLNGAAVAGFWYNRHHQVGEKKIGRNVAVGLNR
jgi:hypothetical protein